MADFRGHLLQNKNFTYTINTIVVEAQVGPVAIALGSDIPRVVYTVGEGASTQAVIHTVPQIAISDITDPDTFPVLGVILFDGDINGIVDVCRGGFVGDYNTSSFTVGDTLYLGTNGDLVNVRPNEDKVVQVAKVMSIGVLDGAIDVHIQEFDNTEPYYGGVSVVANVAVTTVPGQFLEFNTDQISKNTEPDHTEDHIIIEKDGVYEVHCVITATSGNQKNFVFQIYKNNQGTAFSNLISRERVVQINDPATITLSGQIELFVDDTLELWVASVNGSAVTISECSFDLNRIGPIP